MRIVKNKILPFKGYSAMAIYPFILTRKDKLSEKTINHESIHFQQQKELLLIGFFLLYLLFWLRYGYRHIPFELEAYEHAAKGDYLAHRKRWAWTKYISNKTSIN